MSENQAAPGTSLLHLLLLPSKPPYGVGVQQGRQETKWSAKSARNLLWRAVVFSAESEQQLFVAAEFWLPVWWSVCHHAGVLLPPASHTERPRGHGKCPVVGSPRDESVNRNFTETAVILTICHWCCWNFYRFCLPEWGFMSGTVVVCTYEAGGGGTGPVVFLQC